MEKKNREQRRREKFGHTGGATTEPWPQSQANPALSHVAPTDDGPEAAADQSAQTGGPDQGVTPKKGSASGGAAKGPKRKVDREGIHSGDSAKG
jgi:hypothetical protein